jgi:hypothetical protein
MNAATRSKAKEGGIPLEQPAWFTRFSTKLDNMCQKIDAIQEKFASIDKMKKQIIEQNIKLSRMDERMLQLDSKTREKTSSFDILISKAKPMKEKISAKGFKHGSKRNLMSRLQWMRPLKPEMKKQ